MLVWLNLSQEDQQSAKVVLVEDELVGNWVDSFFYYNTNEINYLDVRLQNLIY